MKVITIRNSGVLIAFGPAGTGYDPGVPLGAVKAVEDDYVLVLAEYASDRTGDIPVVTLDEKLASLQTQIDSIKSPK